MKETRKKDTGKELKGFGKGDIVRVHLFNSYVREERGDSYETFEWQVIKDRH